MKFQKIFVLLNEIRLLNIVKRAHVLVILLIFCAGLISTNSASAAYECPKLISEFETLQTVIEHYETKINDLNIEYFTFIDKSVSSTISNSVVSEYLVKEQSNNIEEIGQIAYCLILGEKDPNLIAIPNVEIVKSIQLEKEEFLEITPTFVIYVLDYNKNNCNNFLLEIKKEKYEGSIYGIDTEIDVIKSEYELNTVGPVFSNSLNDVYDILFSDKSRITEILDLRDYLKVCSVNPEQIITPKDYTLEVFSTNPIIGGPFLIYANEEYSPNMQAKLLTPLSEIVCKDGLILIINNSEERPACVKSSSIYELILRGWGDIID